MQGTYVLLSRGRPAGSGGANSGTYFSDKRGQYFGKEDTHNTVTKYAYDVNGNAIADLSSSGTLLVRRIFGEAMDALIAKITSGTTNWMLGDLLGSLRDIAGPTGSLLDHRDWGAFGKLTYESNSSNGDRYGFTGREWSTELSLQYNRARWYDPLTGRWESQDPLGFDAGDSNLYRYVNNRPTMATDPSGLYEADVHFYMTYYIASKIGLDDISISYKSGTKIGNIPLDHTVSAASVIAWANQHTDVNDFTRPPLNLGQAVGHAHPGGYEVALRKYHFRCHDRGVQPGSGLAYQPLKMAIDEAKVTKENGLAIAINVDWMLVGIGLHAYQDSWSHKTFDSFEGHKDAPLGGHAPDYPWKEPGDAVRMAKATYDELASLYTKVTGKNAQTSWPDIEKKILPVLCKVGSSDAIREQRWSDETLARVNRWKRFIETELGAPAPDPGSALGPTYGQPSDMIEKFLKAARRVPLPTTRP